MMHKTFQRSFFPVLVLLSGVPFARAQATKPELPIQIIQPTVDKANGEVSLPGAFWNQHMISWVEVALCGRPSDFLHETIVSVTTTKTLLMQALREVGCNDADAWVKSVAEFPGIRGDRLMIILEVTRAGKTEAYSLDELLQYMGWGVSAGPYGWMFKGDPERNMSAPTVPSTPLSSVPAETTDASKIVHDDPQAAIVYKGIQHSSQSFADHPLSYDEWIYPMMRYGRNDKVLPTAVFDSNGDVPVQVILKKVTEEGLITESAKLWHDAGFAKYMLLQVPIAKKIDEEKGELWKLLTADLREKSGAGASARTTLLKASITAGYAELDAAWANWSCDHTAFETDDAKEIEGLKQEVALWKEHMTLRATWTDELAIAAKAAADQAAVEGQAEAGSRELQQLRGVEVETRSLAALAENQQPAVYWKEQQAHLDRQGDPRADWIKHVDGEVKLCEARAAAGAAGRAYGKALQGEGALDLAVSQKDYAGALAELSVARLEMELVDLDFEISKRQDFTDDPDLPKLLERKKALEGQLAGARAATRSAP